MLIRSYAGKQSPSFLKYLHFPCKILDALINIAKKAIEYSSLSWENLNSMIALKTQNFENYGDLGNCRLIFKYLVWNLNTSFRRSFQDLPFFWCLGI